ncbi:hypothetical protein NPS01_42630 [Nocardioides psychrotolerans]|uniref:Uncharacterized protein n=1 Tax=Nocardioides psychrotolerans TaxID=1005945 RepID=A0A1I3MBM3_9ACTN|nr:hypothetical protein [Nocardioides psychrotolerans]GEP40600.1 hypothetical protein NPS01_42630 [Nocardioides psychrotolerans]SFI94494.1 hypothetical protein SAMN05216561_11542 [Nocardioides psychrotolerans]
MSAADQFRELLDEEGAGDRLTRCADLLNQRKLVADTIDEVRALVDQAATKIAAAVAIDGTTPPPELVTEHDGLVAAWRDLIRFQLHSDARWVDLLLGNQA